jgi:hypothetical protein
MLYVSFRLSGSVGRSQRISQYGHFRTSLSLFCSFLRLLSALLCRLSLSPLLASLGSLLGGGASGLRAKIQDTTVVYFFAREDREACFVWFGLVLGLVWFRFVLSRHERACRLGGRFLGGRKIEQAS